MDLDINIVLLVHLSLCLFMYGLCWFVQVAHYPLFHDINKEDFPLWEQKNIFLTGVVAIPIMTIEFASGLYLLYYFQDLTNLINILLYVIIALSTIIFQVPLHLSLTQELTISTFFVHKNQISFFVRRLNRIMGII